MPSCPIVEADAVTAATPFPALVEALRTAFAEGGEAPLRHHHIVPVEGGAPATLLLMPAWQPSAAALGVKLVTVFPENGRKNLPAVMGAYFLLDGRTGLPRAIIDGPSLTSRRTAAASALAASYLAIPEAERLLIVGAGAMAAQLAAAHAAVRPIRSVAIWARDVAKAEALAAKLDLPGIAIEPVRGLEAAASAADIVSCATLSEAPLIHGRWLKPGAHLDLIGGFTPTMREADDDCVTRASLFIDTPDALHEAGDLVQPLRAGILHESDIAADLFALCRGTHPGRRSAEEITLFKSVGTALEDLAAAQLVAAGFAQLGAVA